MIRVLLRPQMRQMFRDDLTGQGMKFMTTLDVIVQKLDDEDQIAEQYTGLGKSHATMRVHAADFAPMEEALIDTFRYALGARFTDEIHLAWRNAFEQICERMASEAADPVTG